MTASLVMIYGIQLAVTYAVCINADTVGRYFGLIDDPKRKAHSSHAKSTPLVGGIAALVPWAFTVLLDDFYFNSAVSGGLISFFSPAIIAALLGLIILGGLDDRYQLSAKRRLLIKAFAYFVLVLFAESIRISAIVVPSLELDLPLGGLAIPLTVLSLLTLTNAINMADGRNGLVVGMACIWIAGLTFQMPEITTVPLAGLLASLLVVGWFNLRGKLFLGDAGAYALSFLVGICAIKIHALPIGAGGITTTQLATLFAIPGFDMLRLIVVRIRRGVSPMSADQDHLHHRLDRCYGWNVGLLVYLGAVAAPMMLALTGPRSGLLGLSSAFAIYVGIWAFTRRAVQAPA